MILQLDLSASKHLCLTKDRIQEGSKGKPKLEYLTVDYMGLLRRRERSLVKSDGSPQLSSLIVFSCLSCQLYCCSFTPTLTFQILGTALVLTYAPLLVSNLASPIFMVTMVWKQDRSPPSICYPVAILASQGFRNQSFLDDVTHHLQYKFTGQRQFQIHVCRWRCISVLT